MFDFPIPNSLVALPTIGNPADGWAQTLPDAPSQTLAPITATLFKRSASREGTQQT